MFRKIISNLPFHPGLIHQLTFYARRLHQEEAVRRIGAIFTVLALGVQLLMIFSPAQTSLATGTNDIVYGATTKQQIESALTSGQDAYGRTDIRQIYDNYGITLRDIQAASPTTVRSRERSYITTGRGDSPGVDTPIQIPGSGTTIYERSLNVWDIKNYENYYPAITGTATGEGLLKGRQFWILLKGCGNITFEPVPRNPGFEMVKTQVGGGTYKVGDVFTYKIEFRNPGNAPTLNPTITDTLANDFEFVEQTSSMPNYFGQNGQTLTWFFGDLQPSQNWQYIQLKVRVRQISEATKRVCNASSATTRNTSPVSSTNPEGERCVTIDNSCPGTNLPIPNGDVTKCVITCPDGQQLPYDQINNCKSPVAACEYLKITDKPTWDSRTYETKIVLSKGANVSSVKLQINGSTVHDFGSLSETKVFNQTATYANEGQFKAKIIVQPKAGTDYKESASCEITDTVVKPYTRINLSKGVSNLTQNIPDAAGKVARASDELEYTLSINNSGNTDATNYVVDSDALNDILEYADLVKYDGASFDRTNQRLTWPATTIPAKGTVRKSFTVKVKNPIPTTPPSVSDPLSFDYKLRNIYGNEIVVPLDKPVAGQTYETVSSLPNTGPGTSLLISVLATVIIGYFYARSRLLIKEVAIVRTDIGTGA